MDYIMSLGYLGNIDTLCFKKQKLKRKKKRNAMRERKRGESDFDYIQKLMEKVMKAAPYPDSWENTHGG